MSPSVCVCVCVLMFLYVPVCVYVFVWAADRTEGVKSGCDHGAADKIVKPIYPHLSFLPSPLLD